MKKILALILALVMVFALVACGTTAAPAATEEPKTEEPAATEAPVEEPTEAPAEPTEAPAEEATGEEATATMKGFASDVTVTATLDNGTITALTVDASGETAGFGQKCGEEDFTAQFIGKTLPVTLGEDVDAVAGATITSTCSRALIS